MRFPVQKKKKKKKTQLTGISLTKILTIPFANSHPQDILQQSLKNNERVLSALKSQLSE